MTLAQKKQESQVKRLCLLVPHSFLHQGLVNTDSVNWIETAAGGVRRKMIERFLDVHGAEMCRARSADRIGQS